MSSELTQILSYYSISTTVIAFIIATVIIVLKLFIKNISAKILTFAPFVLGIAIYFVYSFLIIKKSESISKTLSYGFLSGSLSIAFIGIFNKIKRGGKIKNDTLSLAILGILTTYTTDKIDEFSINLSEKIKEVKDTFSEKQIKNLIYTSVKSEFSVLDENIIFDIVNAIYLSAKSLLKL